jgi:hypothetical protein
MDLTKMTRAQAERMIASTRDEETLTLLVKHKNSHVQKKAQHKLEKIASSTPAEGSS